MRRPALTCSLRRLIWLVSCCSQRHDAGDRLASHRSRAGRLPRADAGALLRRARSTPRRCCRARASPSRRCRTPTTPRRTRRSACSARPPRALSAICASSGSDSGSHSGRLRAYSQGDGASFVPAQAVPSGRDGDGAAASVDERRARAALRLPLHRSPRRTCCPTPTPRSRRGQDPNREAALPLAPEPATAVDRRHDAARRRRAPGYIFAAPYTGPGQPGR